MGPARGSLSVYPSEISVGLLTKQTVRCHHPEDLVRASNLATVIRFVSATVSATLQEKRFFFLLALYVVQAEMLSALNE